MVAILKLVERIQIEIYGSCTDAANSVPATLSVSKRMLQYNEKVYILYIIVYIASANIKTVAVRRPPAAIC